MFGREKKQIELTISNETIIRVIAFVVGTALLIGFFSSIRHPLTLIFVSIFLSLALNPAVTYISKKLRSKSRIRATALSYIVVITFLIGFFSLILPPLVTQTADFIDEVPQILRDLENNQSAVGDFVRRYNLEDQVFQFANDWAQDTSAVTDQAVNTLSRVVSNLVSIITVLILTFMMLVEGPRWSKLILQLLPNDKSDHGSELAKKMSNVVSSYVNGQMVVAGLGAFFAVVVLTIATTVFDVDTINPVAFGGIVFLFALIPTVGAIISSTIVVLFCLIVSVPLAITMLVFFIIYQQVENATIQPYIQSRANELTPLIVFIAVIVGVGFGGLLGAVIAIPIAGCLKVLFDDYVLQKQEPIVDKK